MEDGRTCRYNGWRSLRMTALMILLLLGQAHAQAPDAAPAPPELPDDQAVIDFLNQTITWYRHLATEEQLVSQPGEVLFLQQSRQMANEVLGLTFDYARAQSQLIAATTPAKAEQDKGNQMAGLPDLPDLTQRINAVEAQIQTLQKRIKALQQQRARTRGKARQALDTQLTNTQTELNIAQARADALNSMATFTSGTGSTNGLNGLLAQIEELQRTVPELDAAVAKAATQAQQAALPQRKSESGGILELTRNLIGIAGKVQVLNQSIQLVQALADTAAKLRAPLTQRLAHMAHAGDALAKTSQLNDAQALRQQQQQLESLTQQYKLTTTAAVPLSKIGVALDLYKGNLERWRTSTENQYSGQIRSLLLQLGWLVAMLIIIFVVGTIWRRVIFQHVQDTHRRYQFLRLRRVVLGIVIGIVVMFNFATEVGSLATVMGFATAGIAVALQNVILSIAGYFFLIGRFGIRVGDRVQIAGVTGDIIDIGLVKLSLMELDINGNDRQPTGRIVVFSNAVVFQPNGNFIKQIPGTNFVWNEVTLLLAPDTDYRQAEVRLMSAIQEIFTTYQASMQHQHKQMINSLNLEIQAPEPQSRLQITQAGVQISLRYPAEASQVLEIRDRIARQLIDTLNREPSLKLVGQGTPNIQMVTVPAPSNSA